MRSNADRNARLLDPVDKTGIAAYVGVKEAMMFWMNECDMYCEECGQILSQDCFGNLIHDYQTRDAHVPVLEET